MQLSVAVKSGIAAGLGIALAISTATGEEVALDIKVGGSERVIFSSVRDGCQDWDLPDTAARAFKDNDGKIHFYQGDYQNRPKIGYSLETLSHKCDGVYRGKGDSNPANYDDYGWLYSIYSLDGRIVYGIVHNEFQGHRRPSLCPSGKYIECWSNSLVAVVSTDGGRSFQRMTDPMIANSPHRIDESRGRHAGYFTPTNIVRSGRFFYFLAHVVGPAPQIGGTCLFRSDDLTDPMRWRQWRRGSFDGRSADPYASSLDISAHVCEPVGRGRLPWPVNNLVIHRPSGVWIAVMGGSTKRVGQLGISGVFYSTSRDLIDWSEPRLLLRGSLPESFDCDSQPLAYPAILDQGAEGHSYDNVGDTASLIFVRHRPLDCKVGQSRDIVIMPIAISQYIPNSR